MRNPDKALYRHTQIGYTSLFLLLPFVLTSLYIWFFEDPSRTMSVALGFIFAFSLLPLLFLYRMTITVDEEHLSWTLGLGAFRNKEKLQDILEVNIVPDTGFFGVRDALDKKRYTLLCIGSKSR